MRPVVCVVVATYDPVTTSPARSTATHKALLGQEIFGMQFVVGENHLDRTLLGGCQRGAQHLGARGGVAKGGVLFEFLQPADG